jgi:hypothetical protein
LHELPRDGPWLEQPSWRLLAKIGRKQNEIDE